MLLLRLVGWFMVLIGIFMFVYGMFVPAIVADSYFIFGGICCFLGYGIVYLFRDKQKAIRKEAARLAEIGKQKNRLLDDDQ